MIGEGFTGRFAPGQSSGFIRRFRMSSTDLQKRKIQRKQGSRFVFEKCLKNKG